MSTLRVSTQPAYVARGCVNSQFTLNRANVAETPAKSVNRCRKSLVYNKLYLQTGFTDGLHGWVGLRWCAMQLQGRQEVRKKATQSSLRPSCESVNRLACFELPAIVSPYARSRLQHLPPTQAICRSVYRLPGDVLAGKLRYISYSLCLFSQFRLHSRRRVIRIAISEGTHACTLCGFLVIAFERLERSCS